MFDDLEALFLENVLTAYNEFPKSIKSDTLGESVDLWLAMNAATALYPFREAVFPGPGARPGPRSHRSAPDYDCSATPSTPASTAK